MVNLIKDAKKYFHNEKWEIIREVIISILLATIVSSLINFYFDNKLDERQAIREFIYNYNRSFFENNKYRNVSIAIEENYLYGKPILKKNSGILTDYELDDYLNFLYEFYTYYYNKIIDKSFINDQFSYYLCITFNSEEIKKYRETLISNGFSDTMAYGFLDDFATDLNLRGQDCKKIE